LIRDDELEDARRLAWQVYEADADALIVQDMGLLEFSLPPIQLHASTQTDNRTLAKVQPCDRIEVLRPLRAPLRPSCARPRISAASSLSIRPRLTKVRRTRVRTRA